VIPVGKASGWLKLEWPESITSANPLLLGCNPGQGVLLRRIKVDVNVHLHKNRTSRVHEQIIQPRRKRKKDRKARKIGRRRGRELTRRRRSWSVRRRFASTPSTRSSKA